MNIQDEKDVQAAHVELLRELFTRRPLQEIEADELEQLVGRNFQQRISELRASGLTLQNIPRYGVVDGRRKRLTGAYRYLPYVPLGRDASTERSGQRTLGFIGESFR